MPEAQRSGLLQVVSVMMELFCVFNFEHASLRVSFLFLSCQVKIQEHDNTALFGMFSTRSLKSAIDTTAQDEVAEDVVHAEVLLQNVIIGSCSDM